MPPSCLVEFSMTLPHGHSKPSCSCTLSFSFSHLVAFPFPRTPRRITPYSNISHHCWLRLPLEVWDTAITTSLCPACGHKPHPDSSEDTRGQAVTFNKVSLKFEDNGKGTWPPTNWQQQCMQLHIKSQFSQALAYYCLHSPRPFEASLGPGVRDKQRHFDFQERKTLIYSSLKSV